MTCIVLGGALNSTHSLTTVQSHMQEFTLGPLGESHSVPGGRQLVVQAANFTFESTCRLL